MATMLSHLNGMAAYPAASAPDVEIAAQVMHITPQMAGELLKNRLPNRPVSKARVRTLIEDMRAGRWMLNGEKIILDHDG